MHTTTFQNAAREQEGLLAGLERKALHSLVRNTPDWIGSDHLTILGFAAMLAAGCFYALSREEPHFLYCVNMCMVLNWIGDSMDGTLARYRNRQRPRYGFYVDHIIDAFSTAILVGGLAVSGYMSERVALIFVIVYFMLCINVYLATYTLGVFKISFGIFSPTELRILLMVGNLALLRHSQVHIAGQDLRLFDLGGSIAIAVMAVILVLSVIRNIRTLYQEERLS
jgi:archaetidylinositol phosphate synthase